MGYVRPANCLLSIAFVTAAARPIEPTKLSLNLAGANLLLALARAIRFTFLSGTRVSRGSRAHNAFHWSKQPQLSPDHFDLKGACHEI